MAGMKGAGGADALAGGGMDPSMAPYGRRAGAGMGGGGMNQGAMSRMLGMAAGGYQPGPFQSQAQIDASKMGGGGPPMPGLAGTDGGPPMSGLPNNLQGGMPPNGMMGGGDPRAAAMMAMMGRGGPMLPSGGPMGMNQGAMDRMAAMAAGGYRPGPMQSQAQIDMSKRGGGGPMGMNNPRRNFGGMPPNAGMGRRGMPMPPSGGGMSPAMLSYISSMMGGGGGRR